MVLPASFILGSQSPFRCTVMKEICAENNCTYTCKPAKIDEKAIRDPDASVLTLKLAHAKADAIIERMRKANEPMDGILITCDQVVTFRGEIREKPDDEAQCRAFLSDYSNSPDPVNTIASVVVTHLATGKREGEVDICKLFFKEIPTATMDRVIKDKEIMWCCGAVQAEHPAMAECLARVEGTMDSVMGLPKALVISLTQKLLA